MRRALKGVGVPFAVRPAAEGCRRSSGGTVGAAAQGSAPVVRNAPRWSSQRAPRPLIRDRVGRPSCPLALSPQLHTVPSAVTQH
eukprot:gene39637-59597_t